MVFKAEWLNNLRGKIVDVCRDDEKDKTAIEGSYWYLAEDYKSTGPRKVILESRFEELKGIEIKVGDTVEIKEFCSWMDGFVLREGQTVTASRLGVFDIYFKDTDGKERMVSRDKVRLAVQPSVDSRHTKNKHYHKGNIDVWDFMRENESAEANIGFHKGNGIKYLARFGKKKGYNLDDLDKVIDAVEALRQICIEKGLVKDENNKDIRS